MPCPRMLRERPAEIFRLKESSEIFTRPFGTFFFTQNLVFRQLFFYFRVAATARTMRFRKVDGEASDRSSSRTGRLSSLLGRREPSRVALCTIKL